MTEFVEGTYRVSDDSVYRVWRVASKGHATWFAQCIESRTKGSEPFPIDPAHWQKMLNWKCAELIEATPAKGEKRKPQPNQLAPAPKLQAKPEEPPKVRRSPKSKQEKLF